MTFFKNRLFHSALAATLLITPLLTPHVSHAQTNANTAAPLRIGVIAVLANQATEIAIAKAKEQGLAVELVEFSDWVVPNTAVAEGSIDLNYFQHFPFLNQFNKAQNTQLEPIGYGYSTTMGIYSKQLKKGDAIPDGATVAIPSDPVNTARALLLLQSAQLITLKDGATFEATLDDVTANPQKLKLVQIEGAHAARSFDDVTVSVTYATFAKQAGLDENAALLYDNVDPENIRRYAIRWVTTPERANDPRIQQFIQIYQNTPEVQERLKSLYGQLIDFAWQK